MQFSSILLFLFYLQTTLCMNYSTSESKIVEKKLFEDKTERSGVAIQKAPPDLQFGLAFTVPFVSLSTDKLLNKFQGRGNYDKDVSSLLKLNVGGLVVAAIVGIAALLFVPSILPGGLPGIIPPGFFPGVLDSMYNHHGSHHGGQYPPEYNSEYNNGAWGRESRQGRSGNGTMGASILERAESYFRPYEECSKLQMCLRGREKHKKHLTTMEHLLEAFHGFKNYTANAPIFQNLHQAYDIGANTGDCSIFKCK